VTSLEWEFKGPSTTIYGWVLQPPLERERERERETRERRERDERERERRETERERERERERETCFKYPYASVMCMLRVAHCVTALSSDAVHCIHLKRAAWRG